MNGWLSLVRLDNIIEDLREDVDMRIEVGREGRAVRTVPFLPTTSSGDRAAP